MAGTVVADTLQAASTSTLVIKNGVANTPPTIQDSAGTQIGTFCRAWVNFNGTTVTNPASMTGVRASFNIASILDNGAGDYTVNFTNAMPDANYAVNVTSSSLNNGTTGKFANIVGVFGRNTVPSTTAIRVFSGYTTGTFDEDYISVSIFR